jgi:hypothetical protein
MNPGRCEAVEFGVAAAALLPTNASLLGGGYNRISDLLVGTTINWQPQYCHF